MPKTVFLRGCKLALRSKVGVKVKCQCHGSRSNFWCAAVDTTGSALPSAASTNMSHYQSKVCVCNQGPCADNCADADDRLLII